MTVMNRKIKILNLLEAASIFAKEDHNTDLELEINKLISIQNESMNQFLEPLIEAAKRKRIYINSLRGEKRYNFLKQFTDNYTIDRFKYIITNFTNWQYPCLELFPGSGQYTNFAVGCEPLYIADHDLYTLEECAKAFNNYYANKRLMHYKITGTDLSPLPQKTFGFVFSLNYLRFENLDFIVNISKNVYNLLLNGGYYMFSYNPLDMYWGINELENGTAFGVNTNDLRKKLEKIGFEIIKTEKENSYFTYILVKKPGEIENIKLGSVIGKIIDLEEDLIYNDSCIDDLVKEAIKIKENK